MVSKTQFISGELDSDIGMITGEIRRVAQVFNDVKRRGKNVEEEAQKAKKELADSYEQLKEGKLTPGLFKKRVGDRLQELIMRLEMFAIKDTTFEQEIEKARHLITQIKRIFPFAKDRILKDLHPVDLADNQLRTAEFYIDGRVKGCRYNINNKLSQILKNLSYYASETLEAQARIAYDYILHTAEDLNALTRLAMIGVLKAYKIVRQEYPLLRRELAGLANPLNQPRRRMPA